MTRNIARFSAVLFAAALVAVVSPASAHVSVSSTDAAQGGFGKAVFRVPNESEAASVNKVVVTLPADSPFAFVNAGSKPGWAVDMATEKLEKPVNAGDFKLTEAVRTITWTATGDGIPVGQFDEFALSGGPFPEAKVIAFTAQETYDDGKVVDWDEAQTGASEPEHPAPSMALAAATAGGDHGDVETTSQAAASDDDSTAVLISTAIGTAALIVALAALVVAVRQNRRRA